MPSKVKIILKKELEKLHTGSLMSRRMKLLQCEESFVCSDRYGFEPEPNPQNTGYIEYKDTIEWEIAYNELKSILSTREHFKKNNE